jgi:hypothetical protein
VLFAHAPIASDLSRTLVDDHIKSLADALAPWSRGKDPRDDGLLVVREVFSAGELASERTKAAPTYVHVLAHGALVPPPRRLPDLKIWGLRLGYERDPGTSPAEIAAALAPAGGRPLVVTLSACDSGNQSQSVFDVPSVVQDLHRAGIPVVVGSQLPLTQRGSVTLTQAFYHSLLQGADVRAALHAGRVALRQDAAAGHDWLSLVAYVRLPPEGYAEHLLEFGLRVELGLLDAAQARADALGVHGGSLEAFAEVESMYGDRLTSLAGRRRRLGRRRDLLDECDGLQASAFKRLAELQFIRTRWHEDRRQDLADARAALAQAAAHYRDAYRANISAHWLGMQQLALEAVLDGAFRRPADLPQVARAAELMRDGAPDDAGRQDFWSCGTLAEATLLAPVAGGPRELEPARAALAELVARAKAAPKGEEAINSTRRQLQRYVAWWTGANGFLPGVEFLSGDAALMVGWLDEFRRSS